MRSLRLDRDLPSWLEVSVEDVGFASKDVGCFVMSNRAVMLLLRLVLTNEVLDDRVDV